MRFSKQDLIIDEQGTHSIISIGYLWIADIDYVSSGFRLNSFNLSPQYFSSKDECIESLLKQMNKEG